MTTATKKKLCWNCEGRVGFSEEHCPFCGVYLSPTSTPGEESQGEAEDQLPQPPYQLDGEQIDDHVHDSPYQEHLPGQQERQAGLSETALASHEDLRKMVTPMGTLLAGSIFFLFGLVLLLFSKDGKLTLQWSSDYWYVYLIISLGMLFWGWRSLQFVDD